MLRQILTTFTRDPDGTEIAHVPLAGGKIAEVRNDDYAALGAEGWPNRWVLNHSGNCAHPEWSYVRVSRSGASGGLVGVARVIMRAGKGQIVRYHDGNRLNLRRDNLYLEQGPAKRCDADLPRLTRGAGEPSQDARP